jgi:predicted NAD/FAD-dependent oxidoreductase
MDHQIIIIGAGISALLAAKQLNDHGWPVKLLEKSRGVGGRMATRRYEQAVFDHGAQFFTTRQPLFKQCVDGWISDGVAQRWASGFTGWDGTRGDDGHTRYRGHPGMNGIPKHIAHDLNIHLNTRAVAVDFVDGAWLIHTDGKGEFKADILILSSPLPQSIALLGPLMNQLPETLRLSISKIEYDRCIALLANLQDRSQIPQPGGMQIRGEQIDWLADNKLKGISPHANCVTIHASAGFSRAFWEHPDEQIAERIFSATMRWLGTQVSSYQIHRWRYSKPNTIFPKPYGYVQQPAPLFFIGDAFAGPRVEGAAISGLSAAKALGTLFTRNDP